MYNFDLLQGQYGCSSAATKVLHADAYYSIAFAGTDWRKISVTNSTAESFSRNFVSEQCDQIWRNFVTLMKSCMPLVIYDVSFSIGHNFEPIMANCLW